MLASHPDLTSLGNDACFGQWRDDRGGRKWLTAALPKDFDPKRQLLAALGCVTGLQFYPGGRSYTMLAPPIPHRRATHSAPTHCDRDPSMHGIGFAGRFHKFWEKSYWPCKERCMSDTACSHSYYETKQWPCKADALRAHDETVRLVGLGVDLGRPVGPRTGLTCEH